MKILDKKILVTGAASGIGKALSIAFKEVGAYMRPEEMRWSTRPIL